jgi:hypothetical protein
MAGRIFCSPTIGTDGVDPSVLLQLQLAEDNESGMLAGRFQHMDNFQNIKYCLRQVQQLVVHSFVWTWKPTERSIEQEKSAEDALVAAYPALSNVAHFKTHVYEDASQVRYYYQSYLTFFKCL